MFQVAFPEVFFHISMVQSSTVQWSMSSLETSDGLSFAHFARRVWDPEKKTRLNGLTFSLLNIRNPQKFKKPVGHWLSLDFASAFQLELLCLPRGFNKT